MNYDKLNDIITASNSDLSLNMHFDDLFYLAQIIIDTPPYYIAKTRNYDLDVSAMDSERMAEDFFANLNSMYLYYFQNFMQEKKSNTLPGEDQYQIKFYLSEKCVPGLGESFVTNDGEVNVGLQGTLNDSFAIVHEITHKLSIPGCEWWIDHGFSLRETPAIAMELLFEHYLQDNSNFGDYEISIFKEKRIRALAISAYSVYFDHILVNLYKENGNHISEEILLNYLESLDKNSVINDIILSNYQIFVSNIIKNNELNTYAEGKYLIGALLGYYIADEIIEDEANKYKLFTIINVLADPDFKLKDDFKILASLGIPCLTKKGITVTDDDIKCLSECYKKQADTLIKARETEKKRNI